MIRRRVPALADFAFAFVATTPASVCVACAHVTAEGTRVVRALRRSYRIDRDDPNSTVAHVLRTGRPVLRAEISSEPPRPSRGDLVAELHRRLAPRSAVTVPLLDGDRVVGALTLCYSQSGRSYQPTDVPAAADLAAHITRVLTRARVPDGTLGLRAATGHPRQGTTVRRRVAARN